MGNALLVHLVVNRHESDAERVQRAVTQQGHHVPAALRVADMRRDMQSVVAWLRVEDTADKLTVLIAELRRVRVVENTIGVERLGTVPCADDAAVGHGHTLQRAPVALFGRA